MYVHTHMHYKNTSSINNLHSTFCATKKVIFFVQIRSEMHYPIILNIQCVRCLLWCNNPIYISATCMIKDANYVYCVYISCMICISLFYIHYTMYIFVSVVMKLCRLHAWTSSLLLD